jgi:hypothetical protein
MAQPAAVDARRNYDTRVRVVTQAVPTRTTMNALRRAYRSFQTIPFRLMQLRARWFEITSIFRR